MLKIKDIINNFEIHLNNEISTKGRVYSIRKMKNFFFADIFFQTEKIQVILDRNSNFILNEGDLIEISGICIYSKKIEKMPPVS